MAERRRGRWLLVTLVVLCVCGLACCCGCGGLWHFFPDILLAAFTEDQPLAAPAVPADPAVGERLEARFASGGPVAITAEELVQLVDPASEENLEAFWVDIRPDGNVELILSVRVDDQARWFNARGVGAFEMDHGWFTRFTLDSLVAGGWDLGQYTAGQQLAQQANQSLANQRAQDPNVGEAMDSIQRLWIEDEAIHIELVEGGWERLKALRE